jgi:hypothetical protein
MIPKTFKELFAGTGIEPTTDKDGGVHYNFKATLKNKTMKTAMQELIFHIAYMERRKYQDEQEKIIGGMNDCIMNDAIVIQNKVIEELTKEYAEYLEKEKEQIKNDFTNGQLFPSLKFEEYYTNEYQKNK